MKLLIIGATGPTGNQLVQQALDLGHRVTALARHPATANLPTGVQVLTGDVLHPDSLKAAVSGQDAVLSSLGSKLSRQPTTLLSDGTRNLVAAMQAASVRRLMCITGIGAGDSKGHGGFLYDHLVEPLLLHEIYLDKTRQEEVVRGSGLDWTLVRPAQLTKGERTGKIQAYLDLTGITVNKISRADVAAFILAHVSESDSFQKTYTLSY